MSRAMLHRLLQSCGVDVVRYPEQAPLPPDFDERMKATIESVRPFTQTSPERIYALCHAVRYLATQHIPGDIVECGVWKGGSMMAAARTLLEQGDGARRLFLYDTFEGMPSPGKFDIDYLGAHASSVQAELSEGRPDFRWNYVSLEEVKRAMLSVGYPAERIQFIKGKVEEMLPKHAPERIALLRLDTDWYESTKHELETLYPRLSRGGVLIIDDYGHFEGARKAVDEYLEQHKIPMLLHRIDYTGRIGLVP